MKTFEDPQDAFESIPPDDSQLAKFEQLLKSTRPRAFEPPAGRVVDGSHHSVSGSVGRGSYRTIAAAWLCGLAAGVLLSTALPRILDARRPAPHAGLVGTPAEAAIADDQTPAPSASLSIDMIAAEESSLNSDADRRLAMDRMRQPPDSLSALLENKPRSGQRIPLTAGYLTSRSEPAPAIDLPPSMSQVFPGDFPTNNMPPVESPLSRRQLLDKLLTPGNTVL